VDIYLKESTPDFWRHGPAFLKHITELSEASGHLFAMFSLSSEPDTDREAPLAALFYMPPGAVLPEHAHDCHRVEVVVQGSISLPDGQKLGPGDISVSAPNQFYGPHIAGPEGSLTVEIFSRATAVDAQFPDDSSEIAQMADKFKTRD
jgi:hypothetical protein